ncbi:unnamed protein product [Plutella xylostella]|uniref:(diamondback moth) hypothetical protein n=1 Tax=Plutella xylostella TaxID=51655 RepID=A0A8S4E2U9_PLUXY|nr:unnamed protein product [Plutella xylostella]
MPTLHLKPGITMARYKKTGFMDEDAGSVSSIQLNEGVRSGGTHIRYHMESAVLRVRFFWDPAEC